MGKQFSCWSTDWRDRHLSEPFLWIMDTWKLVSLKKSVVAYDTYISLLHMWEKWHDFVQYDEHPPVYQLCGATRTIAMWRWNQASAWNEVMVQHQASQNPVLWTASGHVCSPSGQNGHLAPRPVQLVQEQDIWLVSLALRKVLKFGCSVVTVTY